MRTLLQHGAMMLSILVLICCGNDSVTPNEKAACEAPNICLDEVVCLGSGSQEALPPGGAGFDSYTCEGAQEVCCLGGSDLNAGENTDVSTDIDITNIDIDADTDTDMFLECGC